MNRAFYTALKTKGEAMVSDGVATFRRVSMWNGQLEKLKAGTIHAFDLPALFFEFQAGEVDTVGGGVQVFDPVKVRMHVIDKLFDSNEDGEVNLNALDLGDKVYTAFQMYQVVGATYGSSPFNRTAIELDEDHDALYHHVTEFTTTWTDNSANWPTGAGWVDPTLTPDITITTT